MKADLDFQPIMAGDQLLFDKGATDVEAARKLFANQGMHPAAAAFAVTHPRAIQYLEQAPVLAFGAAMGGPGVRRTNALYMAHKLTPLCERGEKLSVVMAAFGFPLPLRKLKPYAILPGLRQVILEVAKLPPKVLGRIIPDKPGAQRDWLKALEAWMLRMHHYRKPMAHRFAWAAEAISAAKGTAIDIGTVADFAASDSPFNEAWRWARAIEEAELWHDALNGQKIVEQIKVPANSEIDLGLHPTLHQVNGLTFLALRTPLEIAKEGKAMRHCVASYIPIVFNGDGHIVSVRAGEKRVATLELGRNWDVRQLKGARNSKPETKTAIAAAMYAREAASIARAAAADLPGARRRRSA